MRVERISPQLVTAAWPGIAPLLRKALGRQPIELYSEWDIERALIAGHPWALWVAHRGAPPLAAIVTRIDDYPSARGCTIFACGGIRMAEWYDDAERAIAAYAKQLGCRFLEARGRKGWVRYAGARCDEHVARKEL